MTRVIENCKLYKRECFCTFCSAWQGPKEECPNYYETMDIALSDILIITAGFAVFSIFAMLSIVSIVTGEFMFVPKW